MSFFNVWLSAIVLTRHVPFHVVLQLFRQGLYLFDRQTRCIQSTKIENAVNKQKNNAMLKKHRK
jgi:hypothetical protein